MAVQRTLGAGNPARPSKAAKPSAGGKGPRNAPKPSVRHYTPPQPQGNFEQAPPKWLTEEALEVYDAVLPRTETDYYAWIPMPMFSAQDPLRFCSTRYEEDETRFGEWAYGTSLVTLAGTHRKLTFCPFTAPPDAEGESSEFISSPYIQLLKHIKAMHRERPFAQGSDPKAITWWHLVEFDRQHFLGNLLPNTRVFYLMLSIMLREVQNSYNKDQKKTLFTVEDHFDPGWLGKGLGDDGAKLTIMAVSNQVWDDLSKAMNGQTDEGEFAYPDPCNPEKLAVFYAWNHKKSPTVPVPGATNAKELSGMTGAVSGVYYGPKQNVLGKKFSLPLKFVTDGCPNEEYFNRVPLHIGDAINYMDPLTQIRELAIAFADARSIFELAFSGTQFEDYLDDPEVMKAFGSVQQKFVYDSSVHEGAPVSSSAKKPTKAAKPAEPEEQEVDYGDVPFESPGTIVVGPDVPLPSDDEVYNDEDGYATDVDGYNYVRPDGEKILAADMFQLIAKQDWGV